MKPRNKGVSETPPVTFEAIMGREGSGGFFGIEDEAGDLARQAKLRRMAERITAYNRGYEGSRRPCPKCGQRQQYKGDRPRVLEIESGTLTIQRAYYVCPACRTTSYPLDEQLGLVEGKEQGRLLEKLALLAVVTPYHQAPQVCETLFGQARPALSVRRLALREAHQLATSEYRQTLPQRPHDRVYLQVDGHMCPTRDGRTGAEEHGYREAKAVLAFSAADVAEVSKERHELLHEVLKAQITDSETFRSLFAEAYAQAHGAQASEVIVLADGAHWIWNVVEDLLPQAIQILDFSHAKQYLWAAAKLIYGEGSAFLAPWVKDHDTLLLEEKVRLVIAHLPFFLDLAPDLAPILHYFEQNAPRMQYGTYRQRGYFIGSGAIESAGKQIAAARIKGPGPGMWQYDRPETSRTNSFDRPASRRVIA